MLHVRDEHGFLALPSDERTIVLRWAKKYDQALWDSVPKAREFMIYKAAFERADCEFYGSHARSYSAYRRLALNLISELNNF